MKHLALLLILSTSAFAQADASKFLADGLEAAGAAFAPVAENDRKALLAATAEILQKHVTFRSDATASAFQSSGETRRAVEWKRLVVRRITAQAVTDADRLNGVSRRFLVSLGCDAHRTWDTKTNRWGTWHNIGNPVFPTALTFERKGQSWTAQENQMLRFFAPGPGLPLSNQKAPAPNPAASIPTNLPPGMSKKGQ